MGKYVVNGNSCIGCSVLEEFPDECGRCNNLKSKIDLIKINAKMKIPNPCTVEQYEEITGEKFIGLVWVRYSPGGPDKDKWSHWEPEDYPEILEDPAEKQFVIVQTGKAAPGNEWIPE